MMQDSKYALVTVTSSSYLMGSQLLIWSFLKHNSWFDGHVVVFCENEHDISQGLSMFENIDIRIVNDELLKRVDILKKASIVSSSTSSRFYSLELFGLDEFDKVIFIDSDILCKGDISPLFKDTRSALIACFDRQYYQGNKRDLNSFLPVDPTKYNGANLVIDSFNSGVLVIDMTKIEAEVYKNLLLNLHPLYFKDKKTVHTDQFILNRYFHNMVAFSTYEYNYIVPSGDHIDKLYNTSIDEAKLIHYVGGDKPWNCSEEFLSKKGFMLWQNEYTQFLRWNKSRGNDEG